MHRQVNDKDGRARENIRIGISVAIVQKRDQCSGQMTEGVVKILLTKSDNHPHGIKVLLQSGEIGRVKKILE